MGTAEKSAADLYDMPDHPALAALVDRGNGLDRALKAVEGVPGIAAISSKFLSYSLQHTPQMAWLFLFPHQWSESDDHQQSFRIEETADNLAPTVPSCS